MKKLILFLLIAVPLATAAQTQKEAREVEVARSRDEIINSPEKPAEYPGGMAALGQFLGANIVFPPPMASKSFSGRVYLKFIIDEQGIVSKIDVQRAIPECPECSDAAVQAVKKMPKWTPATNSGTPVKSYFTLPVKFESAGGTQQQPADSSGLKPGETIHTFVDENPQFPGGDDALRAYVVANVKAPASLNGQKAKSYLTFVVTSTGKITQIKVNRGVPNCPECDAEAIRVVQSMPEWKPGKNHGTAVSSYYNFPIVFNGNYSEQ